MHKVKCFYCGREFDRDKEACVAVNARRYAHADCAEGKDKDLDALISYIKKTLGASYNDAQVRKQINKYQRENNYTYSGIHKTLIWWYEIKGNSIEKANGGIGIVPYVYQEALNYYYALYLAQIANEDKEITDFIPTQRIIEIASPRAKIKQPKLFDMEDDTNDSN